MKNNSPTKKRSVVAVLLPREHLPFIRNWCEHHISQGWSICLYNNNGSQGSCRKSSIYASGEMQKTKIDKRGHNYGVYTKHLKDDDVSVALVNELKGLPVEIITWQPKNANGIILHGQVEAYVDFIVRNRGTVEWASFIDADEYLYAGPGMNWDDLLDEVSMYQCNRIMLNGVIYENRWTLKGKPILLSSLKCLGKQEAGNKNIVRISEVRRADIHWNWDMYDNNRVAIADPHQFRFNHYRENKHSISLKITDKTALNPDESIAVPALKVNENISAFAIKKNSPQKPLISVIMPCYNHGKYVSKAIESILNQTFPAFELIILNDGSTDNSREEIKKYKDRRVSYLESPINKGSCITRNTGLQISTGKYIYVMNADDVAHFDRLGVQYKYMQEHPKIGCIGSQGSLINEKGNFIGSISKPLVPSSQLATLMLIDNYMLHASLVFRRSLLFKYNLFYNKSYRFLSDFELINRCTNHFPVLNIDHNLISRRLHSDQALLQKKTVQEKYADIIRLSQLKKFGIRFTQRQKGIYLKLLKRSPNIIHKDLEEGVILLNKLLEKNKKLSVYNQAHLYDLFNYLLASTNEQALNLGGWAIEKGMMDFIMAKIQIGKSILEFGSGRGTDYLLLNYTICSIEHDMSWVQKRGAGHKCFHAPLENGWYRRAVVKETMHAQLYDLILVDGPPAELRQGILNNLDLFKDIQCPIIFDDVNRNPDMAVMQSFCDSLNYRYEIIEGNSKKFAYCCKITS